MTRLTLSTSALQQILSCPYSYYLAHIQKEKGYMSYATLLGQVVHRFIDFLYSGNHPNRPFYFKGLEPQAKNAWFKRWSDSIINPPKEIRFPNADEAKNYGGYGWVCIKNYWLQNRDKKTPLHTEKRVKFPIMTNIDFVGVFDQIREIPLDVISKFNPSILNGNKLSENYDQVVIVDLKTNKHDYDVKRYIKEANDLKLSLAQYELHEYIQPTAYYWLYQKMTKKLPAGFFWYHLGSGHYYFTSRTTSDFKPFMAQIQHSVNLINSFDYPKKPSRLCQYCDYNISCARTRGERGLQYSEPATIIDDTRQFKAAVVEEKEKPRQLRFKLKVERVLKKHK